MKQSLNYSNYYDLIVSIKNELRYQGISTEPYIVFDSSYWNKNQENSDLVNAKGESVMTSAAEVMMEATGLELHKAIKGKESIISGLTEIGTMFNEGYLTIDPTENVVALEAFKYMSLEKLKNKEKDRFLKSRDHTTDAVRYLFQNEFIIAIKSNLMSIAVALNNQNFIHTSTDRKIDSVPNPRNLQPQNQRVLPRRQFKRISNKRNWK